MNLPKTTAVVRLAMTVSEQSVGEMSAEGGRITLAPDDVLAKAVDITRIQVLLCVPKRQSILAKISKTPVFPIRGGKTGAYKVIQAFCCAEDWP